MLLLFVKLLTRCMSGKVAELSELVAHQAPQADFFKGFQPLDYIL